MMSPEQRTQALTLRLAGYPLSAISEQTGAGITALKALFKESKATRGAAKSKVIDEAQKRLLSDHSFGEQLKLTISELIADDISIIRRLRTNILTTLEQLETDSGIAPVAKGRVLAALSTSLSLTCQTYRKSLQLNKHESAVDAEALPTLTVHYMSADDEANIRKIADDAGGYDIPMPDDDLETDSAIIEEA